MLRTIKTKPLVKGWLRGIANPKIKMNPFDCLDLDS